ncbi:MAG: hypothetical protein K2Q14_02935 [Gammaproteobacteria bacterium]|nr:hypothetical protein [Gammaproteobacteria bacterium]
MVSYNNVQVYASLPIKNLILNLNENNPIFSKERSDFFTLFVDLINSLRSAFTEKEIQYIINSSCTTESFIDLSTKMREHINVEEDNFFKQPGWLKLLSTLTFEKTSTNLILKFSWQQRHFYEAITLQTISFFFDFISPYVDSTKCEIFGSCSYQDQEGIIKKRALVYGNQYPSVPNECLYFSSEIINQKNENFITNVQYKLN